MDTKLSSVFLLTPPCVLLMVPQGELTTEARPTKFSTQQTIGFLTFYFLTNRTVLSAVQTLFISTQNALATSLGGGGGGGGNSSGWSKLG